MMKSLGLSLLALFYSLSAYPFIDVKNYSVGGLDIIHYVDDTLPLYDAILYLPQGRAASDNQIDFESLQNGLQQLSGMHQLRVFPEYSYFYFEGRSERFLADFEKYCDFLSAKKTQQVQEKRSVGALLHLDSVELAEDLFRFYSFGKSKWGLASNFSSPINASDLNRSFERLHRIKKSFFIYGPSSLQKVLSNAKCSWGQGKLIPPIDAPAVNNKTKLPFIYLVDDSIGQVYWTLGKSLFFDELPSAYQASIYNEIIGHPQFGLWSEEARLNRGLVYQLETYFSIFSNYGRVGLRSSTSIANSGPFLQLLLKTSSTFSAKTLSAARLRLFEDFVANRQAVANGPGGDFLRQAVYQWHLKDSSKNKKYLKFNSSDWYHFYRLEQWGGVVVGPRKALPSLIKLIPIKTMSLDEARRILSY